MTVKEFAELNAGKQVLVDDVYLNIIGYYQPFGNNDFIPEQHHQGLMFGEYVNMLKRPNSIYIIECFNGTEQYVVDDQEDYDSKYYLHHDVVDFQNCKMS